MFALLFIILAVLFIVMATTSAGIAGIRVGYDGKGKSCLTSALYGKPVQSSRISGVTPTAGIWTAQTTGVIFSAKGGQFRAGKMMAVDYIEAHGVSTGTVNVHGFVRLKHADFDGLYPGGKISSFVKGTQQNAANQMRFDEHGKGGQHPVFSTSSPLELYFISPQAVAPLYWVMHFVEVGTGTLGGEDLMAGYKSDLDDAQTFATLSPVAGDSFEIKSDRGNAVLKEFIFSGLNVVFGRLSSNHDNFQPNALPHATAGYGCTVIPYRDVPVPNDETMILELASYNAST